MNQNHSGSGDNINNDNHQETHISDSRFGGGYVARDYHGDVNNTTHNTHIEGDFKGVSAGNINNSPITQKIYYNEPQEKRDKNQLDLIKYSKDTATRLLSQSLRNQVYITLNKQVDETKVIPAMQLKRVNQQVEFLPDGTSIIDVYDRAEDIQGRLLILGQPGSGKSTALYKIAEVLAMRAEKEVNHPIPLLFNLSSWTSRYTTIKDWLMDELKIQYGFSKQLAKEYLDKALIIPLLDGLDELRGDRQAACVEAINEFLLPRHWKNPLVVCSRLQEFKLLNTRMGLKGSVILQPLSDAQIKNYLRETKALTIQQLIESDEDWRELAQTPLFLDIMVLANDKIPPTPLKKGDEIPPPPLKKGGYEGDEGLETPLDKGGEGGINKKIYYLMEIYLQEQLEDVGYWQSHYRDKINHSPKRRQQSLKSYLRYVEKPQQTRHYLQWLAKQLERNNQTIFLIEKLQPTDLANKRQRFIYVLILGLIGWFNFGLMMVLRYIYFICTIETLQFTLESMQNALISGLIGGLILGLIPGLMCGESSHYINPIDNEELKIFLRYNIIGSMIVGLIFITIPVVVVGIPCIVLAILIEGLIDSLIVVRKLLIYWLSFGLIFALLILLMSLFSHQSTLKEKLKVAALEIKTRPNQGIRSSFFNVIVIAGFLIIIIIIITGWVAYVGSLDEDVEFFLKIARYGLLLYCLCGQAVLKHFSLRCVLTFCGYSPWNYARFLDYCTEQLLLQRVGGGYRFIHRLLQEYLLSESGFSGFPPSREQA